jgi:hypothetical protein
VRVLQLLLIVGTLPLMVNAVSLRVLPKVPQVSVCNLLRINVLLVSPMQLLPISHLLHILLRLMGGDAVVLHVFRASPP